VWAAGPREVVLVRPDSEAPNAFVRPLRANGQERSGISAHTEEQERPSPRPPSEQRAVEATAAPEPAAEPVVPVLASDEARGQILEWLERSFEGVNAHLRVLTDTLNRQQRALAELTDTQAAEGRLQADMAPRWSDDWGVDDLPADHLEDLPLPDPVEAPRYEPDRPNGAPKAHEEQSRVVETEPATLHAPDNRSGWQEKLRSLSTR
jgi:hypothetical protein